MKHILLIEDDLYLRDLYCRVLGKAGFEVTSAVDGEEGFTMAQNMPDLILLDIMMPKVNGIELLKKLQAKENTKNIPVVLLTNLGQGSIIKNALMHGARGYLMKVRILPNELVTRVGEFLANPNLSTDSETLNLD